MSEKKHFLKTDVLIIGGGVAGCMAAIGAKEQEVDVTILEKAEISRSGDAGGGNDHLLAHLNSGELWDTDEAMLKYYSQLSQGLIDTEIGYNLHIRRIGEIVKRLESYGIEMRDPKTGQFIRTKSFGQPGPYYINFKGKNIKPVIAREVKRLGVNVLNRINVTNLIKKDNKISGAMGFNVRNGDFYIINSKVTIISTGDVTRLWPNPSGLPFNTWQSPFNNGAGHAMAFRAGAELANMELTVSTLIPKGFSAAGLNAFIGMGAFLRNSLGERYMQKYHPMGEVAPRNILVLGTYREIIEGRGPCFIDCRHLSDEAMQHLTKNLLPIDKDTFMIFCEQKGIDLKRDLLEIEVSEIQIAGITGSVSGIVVDKRGKTTIDRLFASGACSVPSYGLSGALATGLSVGIEAAQSAKKIRNWLDYSLDEVEEERKSVYAPMHRKGGIHYRELENRLRQIMFDYVGYIKTEEGLKIGLKKLNELEKRLDEMRVENYHELMRANEFKDLLLIGKLVAIGAIERRESRMGISHLRGDYPEQNDERFHGSIILKKRGNKIQAIFRPAKENPSFKEHVHATFNR